MRVEVLSLVPLKSYNKNEILHFDFNKVSCINNLNLN